MRRFLFLGFPPFLADGELLLAAVRNIPLTFLFYSVRVKLYGALVLSLFLSGLLARHNSKEHHLAWYLNRAPLRRIFGFLPGFFPH